MDKRKSGNALLWIIILVVVVLGLLLFYFVRRSGLMQSNANYVVPVYQPTSGSSNSDLQQDMNTVDSSLTNTTTSTTDVNSGISDTPIAQP